MAIGKDEELKKQLTETLLKEKTDAMRKQIARDRQMSRAAMIDEIEKGRYNEEKKDLWEALKLDTKAAMKMEVTTQFTWASSMFTLIELYLKQCEALNQDLTELGFHVGALLLDGTDIKGIPIPGILSLTDIIGEKISGKPEVIMPRLQYLVEVNQDNKIDFKKFQRYDGDILGQTKVDTLGTTIDDLFKQGIYKWLDDRNYKSTNPDNPEQGTWLHKDSGAELTSAQFKVLKDDPVNGLSQMLSGHFELDLHEMPAGPRSP